MKIISVFVVILQILYVLCDEKCYDNKQQINHSVCDSSLLDIHLSNITEFEKGVGVIKVQFNLALECDFDSYEISLNYNEFGVKEKCGGEQPNEKWKFHSKLMYYRRNNSDLEPCNGTVVLQFIHLYSGCYKVNIIGQNSHSGLSSSINTSLVRFFEFNFKNISIECEGSYKDAYKSYDFTIFFENKFIDNKIDLYVEFRETNDGVNLLTWEMLCLLNTTDNCIFIQERNDDIICKNSISDRPIIECTIENVKEGNYELIIELKNDIRCEEDMNQFSRFYACVFLFRNITIFPNKTAVQGPKKSDINSNILFAIIITSVIMITASVVIIIYVRRSTYQQEDSVQYVPINVQQNTNEEFDIFLVYARDCGKVMEAMQKLKLILEESTKCKIVYDMYDCSYSRELSRGPQDWVYSKLSRPLNRLKVVLVASHCGHIQLQHPTVLYRQSHFYDDLFPLAFRLIADIRSSSYESLFVLSFKVDNLQQYESFVYLTPGRRFIMPESLNELLRLLGIEDIDVGNSENVRIFHEKCFEVETFCRDYPDYIANILNVQINN